jgi:hypothetical protein
VNPLYIIPQDIDPVSSMKGAPTGGESLKVDKPPSPQAEKSAPESLKPPSPSNEQGSTGTEGTPTSSFHGTPSHDTMNISQRSELTETPEVIPPSPWSLGLGAPGGPHTSKGSSRPSSGAQPQPFSHVAESLWDNPDFIQAGFCIGRYVTVVVDSEAERQNIKALFSSLETTLAQNKVIT